MGVNDQSETTGRVQSVDRAVALLQAIADSPDPQTSQSLADRCDLNRSTAWRLLLTLEHHGLVERDPETNRYRMGLRVLKLAGAAGDDPLIRHGHAAIRRLAAATGEIVNLAVPRGLELVFADQVQADHVIGVNLLGQTPPLHATSAGKAFLAALTEEEVEAAVSLPLASLTELTITDMGTLKEELRRIRSTGYAESIGEFEPMLWALSAAVLDRHGRPSAVVSLWGTERRIRPRLEELRAVCVATAGELTDMLTG